jgi:hypothetical protein
MSIPGPGTPSAARPRGRAGRLNTLTAAAVPLALAVTAVAAIPAASAARAPAQAVTAAAGTAADRVPALPGRHGSTTVTLITGDQIRLSPASGGRSVVTTTPAPRAYVGYGTSPPLFVTATSKPGQDPGMYAIPADAAALIIGGRVDKNIFNVGYLAADGDTGAGSATLPVMLRYTGHLTAAQLGSRAGRLPGATVRATDPAAGTVEVGVGTSRAAAFWAGLTGDRAPAEIPPARPGGPVTSTGLAGGIAQVWLAGHQTAASAQQAQPDQQSGAPLYTVTETIHGPPHQGTDPGGVCAPGGAGNLIGPVAICGYLPAVTGLAGSGGVGNEYGFANYASYTCLDTNPCDTLQIKYLAPAGVYYHTGFGLFKSGSRDQVFSVEDPRITVAGDTRLTYRIGQFQRVSVTTPRPTVMAQQVLGAAHTFPDGINYGDAAFSAYGDGNLWTAPSSQPATVGKFAGSATYALIQPPVQMSVAGGQSLTLTPFYPGDSTHPRAFGIPPGFPGDSVRFSGTHSYQVVAAGDGTNYSGLNLKGKLALIRFNGALTNRQYSGNGGCFVLPSQLQGALKAGAAGVIIDAHFPAGQFHGRPFPDMDCPLPVTPTWWYDALVGFTQPPVQIPFVSIPHTQAVTLRHLLSRGPVKITVTDNGQSPYLYQLKFLQQGQVPATPNALHYTLTGRQLATVTTRYHAIPAQPAGAAGDQASFAAWATNEGFVGGVESQVFASPATIRQYYLVSPNLVQFYDAFGTIDAVGDQTGGTDDRVFSQPGARMTEDYFDPPATPGAPEPPTDVFAASPGFLNTRPFANYTLCAFCRQGNAFYPLATRVEGSSPRQLGDFVFFPDPSSIHLYSGGKQIPPDTSLGFVTYQLPPQQARYRLTANDGIAQDTWNFTSAEPARYTSPEGTLCLGDGLSFPNPGPPCAPPPLIFLRYDAGLSLANTVTAPGTHQIQVTAYHQATRAPAVTSLELWTSTDGGTTWRSAQVTGHGNGSYTAAYTVPPLSQTTRTVSLKVEATDAGGNNVTQVIDNAYKLAAAPGGR